MNLHADVGLQDQLLLLAAGLELHHAVIVCCSSDRSQQKVEEEALEQDIAFSDTARRHLVGKRTAWEARERPSNPAEPLVNGPFLIAAAEVLSLNMTRLGHPKV